VEVVSVDKAIGMALCHDLTQIIPGQKKGRAFKKGHIVRAEDISILKDMGKEHLFVWNLQNGLVHEDEAALMVAKWVCGDGITFSEPVEGKVEIRTTMDGLLKVKRSGVDAINSVGQIALATIHGNRQVKKGSIVAGTRIVPLVIPIERIDAVHSIAEEHMPVIEVVPFRKLKIGIVTTGTEVFTGRIKDGFGPVVKEKFQALGCDVFNQILAPDDKQEIANAIRTLIDDGAEMVAVTGGMSVDPDDRTPAGIQESGAVIEVYGTPVLPGSMFLIGKIRDIHVVGLPGCVMYNNASIFDLVVPRLLAGDEVTHAEISSLGYGGLCKRCSECRFPECGFGI